MPSVRTSLESNRKNALLYKQHEEEKYIKMLQRKERRLAKLRFQRNSSLGFSETESTRLKRFRGDALDEFNERTPEDDVGRWRGGKWRYSEKAKDQEKARQKSLSRELLKMKQESDFVEEKLATYRIRLGHFLDNHARSFLKLIRREMMRYIRSNFSDSRFSDYSLGVISAVCSALKNPLFLTKKDVRRAFQLLAIPIGAQEEVEICQLEDNGKISIQELDDYVKTNAPSICTNNIWKRRKLLLLLGADLGITNWMPSECLLRDMLFEDYQSRIIRESREVPFKDPPRYF